MARARLVSVITLSALLALTLALIFGFARSARTIDEVDWAGQRQLVANYLDMAGRNSLAQQKTQLTWDDAFRNAGGNRINPEWADSYIGEYLWSNFSYDRLLLVTADGRPLRAWANGKAEGTAGFAALTVEVRHHLARMADNSSVFGESASLRSLADTRWPFDRHGKALSRWSKAIVMFQGRPALLTVASIIPDTDMGLLRRTPNHLVALRFIDQAFVTELGRTLLLGPMKFGQPAADNSTHNAFSIRDSSGKQLAWIAWEAKRPSMVVANRVSPLFFGYVFFLVAIILCSFAIIKTLLATTRELAASEAQAQHNALHDAMTALPNRAQFIERLPHMLDGLAPGAGLLIAYIDLDQFKMVNDTLGHSAGDELIRHIADRLRRELPADDFVARIGGDEFVLIREVASIPGEIAKLGAGLMAMFDKPFHLLGRIVEASVSVGICVAPTHAKSAEQLLRCADIALYRAKQRGRRRWRVFTEEMDESLRFTHQMQAELRKAIINDELEIAYQPIVSSHDREIESFEALLRWSHPVMGPVSPSVFVPLAEHSGLIEPLGQWVMRQVFADRDGLNGHPVSINLSPLQIMAPSFIADVERLVEEFRIDPATVVFEVTEGVLLDSSTHVLSVLGKLNMMGFRIALDDFGTGYSSLSYLRLFKFDRIKIDRSFVQNIENDLNAQAILCSIVSLGKALRMKIVAEGVETVAQQQLVRAAGCQLMQGYLYWQGMPCAEAGALIANPASQTAPAFAPLPARRRKAS